MPASMHVSEEPASTFQSALSLASSRVCPMPMQDCHDPTALLLFLLLHPSLSVWGKKCRLPYKGVLYGKLFKSHSQVLCISQAFMTGSCVLPYHMLL